VPPASTATTEPGEGVWAVVDGRHVAVGRREWVAQRCGAADLAPAGAASSSSGGSETEVWVGWSGQGLAGRLLLADALRHDARAVVAALRRRGLRVLLLSGDRREAVEAAAAAAGIDAAEAHSGVRPEGKAALVAALRAQGRRVAMVGDGVNDAPALAAADVGIAMGGGTAVAGEAAGVVLLGDRLGQVEAALGLGRATLAKIRQNLGWAVAYNAVGVPLAAGALLPAYGVALSPSLAAGAMALSSIAVVTNSLSLRWTLAAGAQAGSGAGAASRGSSGGGGTGQPLGGAAS
jgi:Cu2+-exporting ATPase